MGRYILVSDFSGRYSKVASDVGSASLAVDFIPYGENWVDGALSSAYTSPFSNNNLTAKDLSIDYSYLKTLEFSDPKKAKSIRDSLDARVKMLISGSAQMVLDDGSLVGQDVQQAWSETQDFSPTYGVGDMLDMQVSSSRIYNKEQSRD